MTERIDTGRDPTRDPFEGTLVYRYLVLVLVATVVLVPILATVYQGEFSTDWHLVLAFITLTILPTVLLFFAAQRYIVAGLTAGAVKG